MHKCKIASCELTEALCQARNGCIRILSNNCETVCGKGKTVTIVVYGLEIYSVYGKD